MPVHHALNCTTTPYKNWAGSGNCLRNMAHSREHSRNILPNGYSVSIVGISRFPFGSQFIVPQWIWPNTLVHVIASTARVHWKAKHCCQQLYLHHPEWLAREQLCTCVNRNLRLIRQSFFANILIVGYRQSVLLYGSTNFTTISKIINLKGSRDLSDKKLWNKFLVAIANGITTKLCGKSLHWH